MRTIAARSWALAVLSALLQFMIFPIAGPLKVGTAAICWVALAPLLLALLSGDREGNPLRVGQTAALGYLCGILFYLGNCSWIYQTMYLYGGMEKPVAFAILVLFSLYLGLYHALFAGLLGILRRSSLNVRGALVVSPFLWVAVELARGRVTGFPWDLMGYAQVDNLGLTRLAPLAGVMAISFVIAAVNAIFCLACILPGRQKDRALSLACLSALLLEAGCLLHDPYGSHVAKPRPMAVMVQENLSVGATALQDRPLSLEEELQSFTRLSLSPVVYTAGALGLPAIKPEIILWPEAPSHLHSNDANFRDGMRLLARQSGVPLVIGSLGVDLDRGKERGYFLYDSAVVFSEMGTYVGRYDKIHLVPWGEYIPYRQFFSFAEKLTEGVGDMDRGLHRSVFSVGGHRYGVFVCYESIFGDEVREFVKNGAQVLVNISDDGWYGDTGAPWQHLNMARMRAIENHRWVLRDTNTGETTSIDPYGRYIATPRHVRTAYELPFEFESRETFYTRFGDWFGWACVLVCFCGFGVGMKDKVIRSHDKRSLAARVIMGHPG